MKLINYNQKDLIRTILKLKLEKFLMYGLYMDYNPVLVGDVIIYGAGEIGKLLCRSFEKKPIAFIDYKKGLNDIRNIKVYSLDDLPMELSKRDVTIIITPIWAYEEICERIYKKFENVKIISVEELLNKL